MGFGTLDLLAARMRVCAISSKGELFIGDWRDWAINPPSGQDREKAIDSFRVFLGLTPIHYYSPSTNANLVQVAPFTPTRKIFQSTTCEANDPFLHQIKHQLIRGGTNAQTSTTTVYPSDQLSLTNDSSLGRLNSRFSPWGGNPDRPISQDVFALDLHVKDPGVVASDWWNFPSAVALSLSNIGRIHRGTPWQTIYLKSEAASANDWLSWYGHPTGHPTNDWQLISVLSSMLNTKAPADLLSINSTNIEQWSAAFQNMVVSSNKDDCSVADITINSESQQVTAVVDAIGRTRAGSPSGYFESLGAILATPELTLFSPWLNFGPDFYWHYCMTDAAIEAVPSQLLGKLRADPVGSVIRSAGSIQVQFTVLPGHTYEVQASEDLQTWRPVTTNSVSENSITFSESAADRPHRFYRLNLVP